MPPDGKGLLAVIDPLFSSSTHLQFKLIPLTTVSQDLSGPGPLQLGKYLVELYNQSLIPDPSLPGCEILAKWLHLSEPQPPHL